MSAMSRSNGETLTVNVSTTGSSRELRNWAINGRSALSEMRAYCRNNGVAGAIRADGSYLMLYIPRGESTIRQRTWGRVSIINRNW